MSAHEFSFVAYSAQLVCALFKRIERLYLAIVSLSSLSHVALAQVTDGCAPRLDVADTACQIDSALKELKSEINSSSSTLAKLKGQVESPLETMVCFSMTGPLLSEQILDGDAKRLNFLQSQVTFEAGAIEKDDDACAKQA